MRGLVRSQPIDYMFYTGTCICVCVIAGACTEYMDGVGDCFLCIVAMNHAVFL